MNERMNEAMDGWMDGLSKLSSQGKAQSTKHKNRQSQAAWIWRMSSNGLHSLTI
jgi:hypothetical protein